MLLMAKEPRDDDRTQVQIKCSWGWRRRVTKIAKDRKITVSGLIRDLVSEGLDEVEEMAAFVADPVLMEVMRSMFSNAEVLGSMMEVVARKRVDDTQMQLFEDGMRAFQKVVKGSKKKARKR